MQPAHKLYTHDDKLVAVFHGHVPDHGIYILTKSKGQVYFRFTSVRWFIQDCFSVAHIHGESDEKP